MKSLLKQILHAGMELIRDSSKLIRLRIQMHQRQIKEIEIWQRKQRYRVYAETLGRLLAECFRGKSYFVLLKPVTNPDDVRINFQQPVTRKNGIAFFCYRMQKTSKEPIESYRYHKIIADMNYDYMSEFIIYGFN